MLSAGVLLLLLDRDTIIPDHNDPPSSLMANMKPIRHQYNIFNGSIDFQRHKTQKCIDGNIYIFNANTAHHQSVHSLSTIATNINNTQ